MNQVSLAVETFWWDTMTLSILTIAEKALQSSFTISVTMPVLTIYCFDEDKMDGTITPWSGSKENKILPCMFYTLELLDRPNAFYPILRGCRHCHQYLVDQFLKMESEQLYNFRENQQSITGENCTTLRDQLVDFDRWEDGLDSLQLDASSFFAQRI